MLLVLKKLQGSNWKVSTQGMESVMWWGISPPCGSSIPKQSSKQNESPPNMATPENLLPPQAPEMKVGWKFEYGKHHSLPQVVLISTYDKFRVCANPWLQRYCPQMEKWRTILQRSSLHQWRTSWPKTYHPWWIGHGHHRISKWEFFYRFYMMIQSAKNSLRGHSAVSSTATSEIYITNNVQDPSHLLMDSKWMNVTTIHDQALAHGYKMDVYQVHGPPQKRTHM